MTLAIGLLAGAVFIALSGPLYLRAVVSPRVRPGVALTVWVASAAVVVAGAVAGAVLLVLPHRGAADHLIGMAWSCANAVHAGGEPVWEHVLRLGAALPVFAAAVRTLFVAYRLTRREAGRRRRHLRLLRVLSTTEPDSAVMWLEQAAPVAYSLGGRRGAIVATTGVSRLGAAERDAILAHERAHLSGNHHRLVLMADVLARALPFVPLFRAAPPVVRVLVELAADAAAATRCGPGPVRAALRAVSGTGVPAGSLAMSREAVELRLRWLGAERGSLRGRTGYLAAVFAAAAPAMAAVGVVAGLVLLYCLSDGRL
ncbi:M56 family metallopeptidase [Saccharopolyspora erythraea]|uniref:M56 family metallopeptidase n=1 Tax=Saccharopolyspora erythraea TaxID=1836 RepID=UPI001BA796BB|nr:M56 family metallopeptidase [Saccharopolyspora erythraea]QUG99959.1 M56 family metallopeptidase [Saccharopolyspora erythraea]